MEMIVNPTLAFSGGTCKEHAHTCSQYHCTCPSGYTGKNCERESDGEDGGGSPGGGPQLIDVNGRGVGRGGSRGFDRTPLLTAYYSIYINSYHLL